MSRSLVVGLGVVIATTLLYMASGWYGARGWCNASAEVRLLLADAEPAAQPALAAGQVAAVRARAERMLWPRDDLAGRVAEALAEVAGAESGRSSGEALRRFVLLDNEFRHEHCRFRP